MDPRGILEAVAARYAALQSLSVEAICTDESGGEESSTRLTRRLRAWYRPPGYLRIELGGALGSTTVADGAEIHHCFSPQKLYSKRPLALPLTEGQFNPAFRSQNAPFLFSRIIEDAASADYVTEQSGCHVIRVSYENGTSALFHVDAASGLIRRLETGLSASRQTLDFTLLAADAILPESLFEYTPPPDATPFPHGGSFTGGGFAGGSIGGGHASNGRSCRSSHEWHGETLVERLHLQIEAAKCDIERRLTVSEDRAALTVKERFVSPHGTVEREFTVPLKRP
jgi:outer membrane lipoprotein-sorting protein